MEKEIKEWSFVFFDMGFKESARRVRLHRNLRRVGATIPEDSVEELVEAYNVFISAVMEEVNTKLEELEDAKASAVDIKSKRGYTKRLNKMYERVEHLEYIATLGQNIAVIDKVEEFKRQIVEIDDGHPGKLI